MTEFKDKIPAAGGEITFIYHPGGQIGLQISGTGFRAVYMIAVSMDGRAIIDTVPATGIGVRAVYRQPSIITYIQSDEQGMWGRNCPFCERYFRTNHIWNVTVCPYCACQADSLLFISKDQRKYITASYDAFARACINKHNSKLDLASVTDITPAWHYEEEKQQFHFKCDTDKCGVEADILGEYGFCPQCGRTNSRRLFSEAMDKMLARFEETNKAVVDRSQRGEMWEKITVDCVSKFEPLAKHLRARLLLCPMTEKRRRALVGLNFQRPLDANTALGAWFDISLLEWPGSQNIPARKVSEDDMLFIRKMIQKRHVLVHNGGIVDDDYIKLSGDSSVRPGERISVKSKEAKRFIECTRTMGANLLDNIECGLEGLG